MMMRPSRKTQRAWLPALLTGVLLAAAWPFALAGTASPELVLVAGATGRTGKLIVQQLLEKNYRVRALVRDAARANSELSATVEVVVADVRDRATLGPAMKGVKYVISAIGAGGMKPAPGNTAAEVDFQGNANLAAAASTAGVKQFVLVSSVGTGNPAANPMEFMRPILTAKAQGEAALRSSGVPYTIVRPGGLLDEAGGRLAVKFSQDDAAMGRIPRADVATVCVEALGRKAALRRTFAVLSGSAAGPENWDREFKALKSDAR